MMMGVVIVLPVIIAMVIPMTVVTVIIAVIVIMISAIVVPVMTIPRAPVRRIIVPAPRRMPYNVSGHEHEPNNRPGSYFIRRCPYNSNVFAFPCIAHITRVRCFIKYGLNNIIFTIQ